MDRFDPEDRLFDLDSAAEHQADGDAQPAPPVYPMDEDASAHVSPHPGTPTGAELRRRLITPDVLAAMTEQPVKPSLLQRLFGRR